MKMSKFANDEERKKYIADSLKKDEEKRNKRYSKRANPSVSVLNSLNCKTAAENTENDDAKYAIDWILNLFKEGKNIDDNYDGDPDDAAYELAQSASEESYFRLDQIFYYADVRSNQRDWIEDYLSSQEPDDIDDIIQWGVFGMALYIVNEGYDDA